MRDRLIAFMSGRRGIDELSKWLFWGGILCVLLSVLLGGFLAGIPGFLFRLIGLIFLFVSMVRAFSRQLSQRESENIAFLRLLGAEKRAFSAMKDRFAQRRHYRFFRCPGCGQWLRVPRGKGKIHINCKCGYILYRRT